MLEGEMDDAEEYAYYALRYDYTMRSVLVEDVNVINTVQDGPPTISLYERAYQWFKDVISVHFIHHKRKTLAFSMVSIVIVVYFAIGNPSKEEARILLVNEREPTASPTWSIRPTNVPSNIPTLRPSLRGSFQGAVAV